MTAAKQEPPRPADKTIKVVLEEFLADQGPRLKAGTLRKYEDIIHLFQSSLNHYAYPYLDEKESKLFDRLYQAQGEEHREFCAIFGPDKIPDNVGEFLNYFMVRKVMCGKELKRAAGTVIKRLGRWLQEKGYVGQESGADIAGRGATAARELPATEELLQMFAEYLDSAPLAGKTVQEDYFRIEKVTPGRLYLSDLSETETLVVPVPHDISNACQQGWTIAGAVARTAKGWRLQEVWNIYP
jgi:hypothetical protein